MSFKGNVLDSIYNILEKMHIIPIKDTVYGEIPKSQEHTYQTVFYDMLNSVDVNNLTYEYIGHQYDIVKAQIDKKKLHDIAIEAQEKKDIGFLISLVMFFQYVYADVMLREKYKDFWINKVIKRKRADFFPDSAAVVMVIMQDNKLISG